MNARLFSFVGANAGQWSVRRQQTVSGAALAAVTHISMVAPPQADADANAQWTLRGVTSNDRYVERPEKQQLVAVQEGLGRVDALYAALIPIRKTAAWWSLTQDERRSIFEKQSRHIGIGMQYLPEIARRLHHCRDLSTSEPFDFVTWFEYAPVHEERFDEMLEKLRSSPEWEYVDRESDFRLQLA